MGLLPDNEIAEGLVALPGWSRDGDAIVRVFDRGNFVGAVDFLNRITPIAEAANHHPDVAISWKDVTVTLTTHSAGGITGNDLALAAQIDEAATAGTA
ncbi:MAG: 4a-hydroxytetrahydrobiopterin dehydratase [Solirubrobacterales bacterium]